MPLLLNIVPTALLITEFVFDAIVIDMINFYIPTCACALFVFINFLYTKATNEYYSSYFEWQEGDISLFNSVIFVVI